MAVAKWFAQDPEIGSPVVLGHSDPAMADKVVHFVGRQRGATLLPSAVRALSTEQRLAAILTSSQLHGFHVYQSKMVPVVSMSDLSAAELETAFARGLNARGKIEPWAVVLDRHLLWDAGFRPVVYAESARVEEIRAALSGVYGPKGSALVVRTEMGLDDWTAEREWRFCFDVQPMVVTLGEPLPPPQPPPALNLNDSVRAVIVGRSGWTPWVPSPVPSSPPPERWLWDDASCRLIHDGRIPLR